MSRRLGSATPSRPLAAIGLVAVPVIVGVVAAQFVAGIPVRHMVSDTRSIGDLPLYAGSVSYLGILAWAAAASICLFAATLISREHGRERVFLLRAGLLSAFLGIDDLMELHERAFAAIGIPEAITYFAYAALAVAHLALSVPTIRRTQWWLLAFSLAWFAASVASDFAIHFPPDDSLLRLLEEGTKLVGILAWLAYHADTARALVQVHGTPGGTRPHP